MGAVPLTRKRLASAKQRARQRGLSSLSEQSDAVSQTESAPARNEVDMYIIVGLGNYEKKYENTRHNIGFEVIDKLAEQENISILEMKHRAVIGKGMVAGQKCILAKPLTYMNLSGECVRELVDYYKVDETAELVVISDDISLNVGQLRIRKKGSAGGHNGLKNIIAHLGHDTFVRIRVGVGEKPKEWDLADYVLGHFSTEERKIMDDSVGRAADGIRMILSQDVDAAMNGFNKKNRPDGQGE